MPIVYKATNVVNGKFYIGVTKKTLKERIYGHFWAAANKSKMIFHRAIRKYGKDNFIFEKIDEYASHRDALSAEIRYIFELKPPYNVAVGGGIIGIEWSEKRRETTIRSMKAAWTLERRQHLSAMNKGKKPSASAIKNSAIARAGGYRAVICLDDGRVFKGLRAAEKFYGIKSNHIGTACSGVELSAHGKHFAYYSGPISDKKRLELLSSVLSLEAFRYEKIANSRRMPAVCETDGKSYSSAVSAAKAYGMSDGAIRLICKNGGKTLAGLSFRYADKDVVEKKRRSDEELKDIKRRQLAGLKKANIATQKKVMCQNGIVFDSITFAAAHYKLNMKCVSAAMQRNGKCGGISFKFVEPIKTVA